MGTVLANFKAAVESRWESITATVDGSGRNYRFIDTFDEERGYGQHRQLIWRLATTNSTVSEHEEQREWSLTCELFLARNIGERTYEAYVNAVEGEATDLALSFNRMAEAALGAGVRWASLDRFALDETQPVRAHRAGGVPMPQIARVTFFFRVLVQEV